MTVTLRPYADPDLELTLRLETDPVAMVELGGPRDREPLLRVHGVRVRERHAYVVESDGDPVGTMFAWGTDHDGEPIQEVGWMVLPSHHGRGIATAGLRLLLDLMRADPDVPAVHAFPGTTNTASNRLCDRFGFADLGEVEVDFGDAVLQVRHRRLDLDLDLDEA